MSDDYKLGLCVGTLRTIAEVLTRHCNGCGAEVTDDLLGALNAAALDTVRRAAPRTDDQDGEASDAT